MKSQNKKVLLVVTSHDKLGETGYPTGFWYEELSNPYYAFKEARLEPVIASTQGGKVTHDPASLSKDRERPESVRNYLADASAQHQIANTLRISAAGVRDGGYDAIFLVGGHGAMWDFPNSEELRRVVRFFLEERKVVAAVCHGPAGFLNASDAKADSLIRGRRLTGFSNHEEELIKLNEVVPFLLEDRLKDFGAFYTSSNPFVPHCVVDENLITGQNPASSGLVAKEVIRILANR